MKKTAAAALAALMTLNHTAALAARYVTNGEYTAYAGAKSYLYLVEPDGSTKRLKVAELDLLSMDSKKLYYATGDKIYSIDLAASQATREVSGADEKKMDSYRFKGAFTLKDDGTLYWGKKKVTGGVVCASANSSTLYYVKDSKIYQMSLKKGKSEIVEMDAQGVTALAAAENHLILLKDGAVITCELDNLTGGKKMKNAAGEVTDLFLTPGNQLNLYMAGEEIDIQTLSLDFDTGSGLAAMTAEEADASEETEEKAEETEEKAAPAPKATAAPKATQKPAVKAANEDLVDEDTFKTLQRGSKGSQVKKVQNRLKALGYAAGVTDGVYGSQTIRGVRSFQRAVNMEPDGRVDGATWNALFSEDAPYNPAGNQSGTGISKKNSSSSSGDSGSSDAGSGDTGSGDTGSGDTGSSGDSSSGSSDSGASSGGGDSAPSGGDSGASSGGGDSGSSGGSSSEGE